MINPYLIIIISSFTIIVALFWAFNDLSILKDKFNQYQESDTQDKSHQSKINAYKEECARKDIQGWLLIQNENTKRLSKQESLYKSQADRLNYLIDFTAKLENEIKNIKK